MTAARHDAEPAWSRAARRLGCRAQREFPLGPRTTYRVGGNARVGVVANSADDLAAVGEAVAATGASVVVVGNGSNLLVADAGFDGVAVVLSDAFDWVTIVGEEVTAGGATLLPVLARRTAAAGLTGLEWAVGVPGSVGGAVAMNAGGHGSDVAASLLRATIVDLTGEATRVADAAELRLSYRHSALRASEVVLDATFALRRGDRATAEATVAEIVRWRRANQPGGQNAGSVFTNPPGDAAGRLIDAAGCKGLRVGSAEVSAKHANFIQADAGGSADDVYALMAAVINAVLSAGGPRLVPETRLLGFAPERSGDSGP